MKGLLVLFGLLVLCVRALPAQSIAILGAGIGYAHRTPLRVILGMHFRGDIHERLHRFAGKLRNLWRHDGWARTGF